MDERIGSVHLAYRLRSGGTLGPASVGACDRAIQLGLADAFRRRMSDMLGDDDDDSVIVIRELKTSVRLDQGDIALDSHVVDRVSRSLSDAALALVHDDASAASVMRFADQAEFVGSFIVSLIDGSAWSRWYFGAFAQHRRSDDTQTLRAVLEDCGPDAPTVFGWLSRHGHLPPVLALISPAESRRLLCGRPQPPRARSRSDGTQALVDAARLLLAALEPDLAASSDVDAHIARVLDRLPIAADWSDARSLSVRTLELVRRTQREAHGRAIVPVAPERAADVRALLNGRLDWLDTPWLAEQLLDAGPPGATWAEAAPRHAHVDEATTVEADPAARRHLLTPRQDQLLDQIARALRAGTLRLAGASDEDELVVRLIAGAASGAADGASPDRSIVAVIECVARACLAVERRALGAGVDDLLQTASSSSSNDITALRGAGPSAVQLLRAVIAARRPRDDAGEASAMAGIYLLARAVSDLRLPSLADRYGVPLSPLLAALATQWMGQTLPRDEALRSWCANGDDDISSLDHCGNALDALNDGLLERLIDQHVLPAATARSVIDADAASLDHRLACADAAQRGVRMCASLLMRAWARWLPGLSGASPTFLLERGVRRSGWVRIAPDHVFVQLEPAPLDVVLQMAGYLAPVDRVSWLGNRRIVYTLADARTERADVAPA